MPKTLSLLAVLKKVDAKGIKSLSDPQWNTFLASNTEPNEIKEKIAKLEGYEKKYVAYDKTGELIPEDNNAMIDRFKERTGRAKGRESLKVKKSKINVKSFKENFLDKEDEEPVVDKSQNPPINFDFNSPPNPDLSPPDSEEKEEETEGLKGIRDVLDDILKVLRLDFKSDRKEARDGQKQVAKDKRKERENKLEGGLKKSLGGIGAALKGIEPISKIWDAIINFLKFTLIGVLFNKTLSWFSDPKNEKKAQRIGKFFNDWWPALATAAALWLTPLGGLLKGVVGFITAIIPKLALAIATNPYAALAVVGTGLTVYGISKLASMPSRPTEAVDKSVEESGREETIGKLKEEQENRGVMGRVGDFFTGAGSEREQQIDRLEGLQKFNKGGKVRGQGDKDTVPAMLTPGEFVMSKGAVQQYGVDTMEAMNAAAGGTNIPVLMPDKKRKGFPGGGRPYAPTMESMFASVKRDERGNLKKFSKIGGKTESELTSADGSYTSKTVSDMTGGGLDKTTTSTYTKTITNEDGSVTTLDKKKRMRNQIASIAVSDLIEHKEQLLSEIHKLKGFENVTIDQVINQKTGIPEEKLLPILLGSDAQKETSDKEDKAMDEDLKARGIKPGEGYNISANDEVAKSLTGTMGYRIGQTKPDILVSSSKSFTDQSKTTTKRSHGSSLISDPLSDLSASINASVKMAGGGLVQYLNSGGLVSNSNSNSISNFNNGGLVQYLNNGGKGMSTSESANVQGGKVVSGNMSQSRVDYTRKKLELEKEKNQARQIYGFNSPEVNQVKKQLLILDGIPAESIHTDRKGNIKVKGFSSYKGSGGKEKKKGGGFGLKRMIGGIADIATGHMFDFDNKSGGGLLRKIFNKGDKDTPVRKGVDDKKKLITDNSVISNSTNNSTSRSTSQNSIMQMGKVVSGNMNQLDAEKLKREIELEEAEERAMDIYGIDSPEHNEVKKQQLILSGTPAEAIYTDKDGTVKMKGYSTFDGKDKKSKSGGGFKRGIGGVMDQMTGNMFDFDKQSGGGLLRKTANAAGRTLDMMTGGIFNFDKKDGKTFESSISDKVDLDKYSSTMEMVEKITGKEPVGTPVIHTTNKTITLPPIKANQNNQPMVSGNSEIPKFRIPIVSSQRSMVLASLGIEDRMVG